MLAQLVNELLLEKAVVADLHGMAQWCVAGAGRFGRVIEPGALSGLMHGLAEAGGQQGQEGAEQLRVIAHGWRKLPQEGAELVLELQGAGGKEVGHGLVDVPQASDMSDVARRLDAEHEVVGRGIAPAGKAFRGLQRVEGAVDLDAGHGPGGVLEFPALHQPLGVEVTPPGRVAPAGYADMDAFHAASTQRFGAAGEGGSLAGKVSSSASSRRSSASSCAGTRLTLVQPQA